MHEARVLPRAKGVNSEKRTKAEREKEEEDKKEVEKSKVVWEGLYTNVKESCELGLLSTVALDERNAQPTSICLSRAVTPKDSFRTTQPFIVIARPPARGDYSRALKGLAGELAACFLAVRHF